MCLYPNPPAACEDLGTDRYSVNSEDTCRCDAQSDPESTGVLGDTPPTATVLTF